MAWFPGRYDETEDDLATLIDLEVDRICANRPDKLQLLIKKRQTDGSTAD